tara:strand:- start:383 stop:1045 length:663 start_codon:yes stop_codon:yes gene_type:complete
MNKKSIEKTKALPSQKRALYRYEKILAAASKLITKTGRADKLTINQIAKLSGVPRVSVYYFFHSSDQVVARLYELALSEMIAEMETLEVEGAMHWKDAVVELVRNTANYYRTNKLTMILSLSPHSHLEMTPINRAYAKALFNYLTTMQGYKKSLISQFNCEIAVEIADAIWRKSFLESGTIKPAFDIEVIKSVVGYLSAIPESDGNYKSISKLEKLKGEN